MLDFNRSYAGGQTAGASASDAPASRRDLPKANAWLNFGYTVDVNVRDGDQVTTESRFVSLPVGIPLDTMEPLVITTRNPEFGQFQAARNDVLAQLKAVAATMQPGEERIIALDTTTGLAVQLRRVNGPAEVPAADASNPFAAKLNL